MNIEKPNLCDRKRLVIQIDRIACLVSRGKGIAGRDFLAFRYCFFDLFPFLVRHGNVDLMSGFAIPDRDGISFAGYGLAGQIGRGRFLAFQFPHKFRSGGFVIKRPDKVVVPKDISITARNTVKI